MKLILPLFALLCATVAHAGFVTTTVTFDDLTSLTNLGSSYSTGGLTFSSPTALIPATGYLASELFAQGSSPTHSPGIAVNNNGWLTIATGPGLLMTDVTLEYGFDWSWWALTSNILDEFFSWQEFNGDTLVGSGQTGAQHHPSAIELTSDVGFDRLLVRSTVVQYEVTSTNGLTFTRTGKIVSATDANRVALDTVIATYDPPDAASVCDGGTTAAMLAIGLGALLASRGKYYSDLARPV